MIRRLFATLFSGSRAPASTAPAAPRAGDLWSVLTDDGRYGVVKILATDGRGVHARLYAQRFAERPGPAELPELTLAAFGQEDGAPFSMGHVPLSHGSFGTWQPEFVAGGTVADDELEGYRIWQEARGGYF